MILIEIIKICFQSLFVLIIVIFHLSKFRTIRLLILAGTLCKLFVDSEPFAYIF